jgi:hypothetical protein
MDLIAAAVKENLLKPLLRRAGTAVGVLLLSGGDWACRTLDACGLVTDDGAKLVVAYGVGVICLVYDLLVSYLHKRSVQAKAITAALTIGGVR